MNHSRSSEYAFIARDNLALCWLCEPPAGAALGIAALRDPRANVAVPHGLVEDRTLGQGTARRVEILPWRSERAVVSTGMIHSSARDMAQWMMLHLAGGEYRGRRLISAAQMIQIHSAQALEPRTSPDPADGFEPAGYAMGWRVGTYRGLDVSHHGGGRVGFSSHVWLFPERKLGVVVLENLDYREDGTSSRRIALRFADSYLGVQVDEDAEHRALESPNGGPTPVGARRVECSSGTADSGTSALNGHAGAYRNDILGDVQVVYERDRLALVFEPGAAADLVPAARGRFTACFRGHEQRPTAVGFVYDRSGGVTGFVMGPEDPEEPSRLNFTRVR